MKDFDEIRAKRSEARDFQIGGEQFRMRAVRPEVLLGYEKDAKSPPSPELLEARRNVLRASIDHPTVNGNQSAEATLAAMDAAVLEEEHDEKTTAEVLPRLDGIVTSLLEPADDARARYKALREREDDPLTLADLQSLVSWMLGGQRDELEEETGRPTGPPSSSGNGHTATTPPLTVVSALPAPPAAPSR